MAKRPLCPDCGNELVFCSLVAGDEMICAWLCDCSDQLAGIKSYIVQAREWEEQALVYDFGIEKII